jgi:Barstar (barnase inhibitor).
MENKICFVNSKEMEKIKKLFSNEDSMFCVEINGKNIQKLSEYLFIMSRVFKFPYPSVNLDGYNDWMTDLDWLEKDEYILIISNFTEFMKDDLDMKNQIIKDFKEDILPWWQGEVEQYMVGGKAKPFHVYLVD